jgi:hypothetical protein
MNEAFIVALAGLFIQAGILVATVKFLGRRQDEQHEDTVKDLNGLGRKQRSMMAEQIIQAAITAGLPDNQVADFAVMVRKLINGI